METSEKSIERLREIIKCANDLGWINKPRSGSGENYPTMQLSEIEKCMLAMIEDFELERLKRWVKEGEEISRLSDEHTKYFERRYTEMHEALKKSFSSITKK